MSDNDLIRRGQVLERLELAEHDAEERDWRSGANEIARLRKYVAAIPAAQPTVSPDVAALVEALELTVRADNLRETYHALPNDRSRIGDKKSRKSIARDAWLRAFRKASSTARAALAEIKPITEWPEETGNIMVGKMKGESHE